MEAGFTEGQFLSNAGSLPDHRLPCVTVATDDVNAFVRLSRAERDVIAEPPLTRLDEVWADMNILPKHEKSVDLLLAVKCAAWCRTCERDELASQT